MSRLGYVASAKLLVILMLLCFFTYALTNLSTTKAYLSVLPVEIHAVLPYFGSLVLNGIDGLVKYLSSVPMEFKGVTQYFTSFSINGSAGLLNYLSVAPMDSNGITSYLTSFTINSINSFLIVWIVFKWADRLIIRHNKELIRRVALLESSVTKLREAADKLQEGHDGHTGQIERLEERVEIVLNTILDVEELQEWLPSAVMGHSDRDER
ncbi:MAG: hypothetical protein LQ337_001979 [Flavoplaca oasis]|nr:MAG: hypothetical protein LQ337_001979 [Flavoplaca oasis]